MLNNILVLVAEDEAVIALDITMAIYDAGGQVAGPAASVKQAMNLISTMPVEAAILDINLSDGNSSPVALALLAAGIPIVLQSGVGLPADLMAKFPDLTAHIKPCSATSLVHHLASIVANR